MTSNKSPTINRKLIPYRSYISTTIRQSPTEKRISNILKKYKINFIQECSFKGFGKLDYPYRFDFYLPDYNLIIEYDGMHHSKPKMKVNDNIKNKFCKLNDIKIIRYNIKHYENLETHVKKLIRKLTKKIL